ncbi:hypothetical protein RC86_16765 [Pectobacterium brasiliense]|uniref:Uncharacterized protein n=2 Tax=Pectobacterium TaxID=122277 RepID=A0AAW3SXU6_9GAMM|nr:MULTISPECIES: hypothetical protein [Pectobacterium]KHS88659.1 hypothetical protein RC86_16765 [Pectobacterium brasiliense]MBA5203348.1 hypothetical protein [Pectobacterium aroidearum]MBB1525361.1 hypothetical protein [Pectobacterium carotovorum subsp. carotovorum]MBN3343768.1 hypothetical protein [Pectobacterium brasiliense]URG47471.1 hypothetical protein IG609_011560 [Pectobacterium quasiaquaticum]
MGKKSIEFVDDDDRPCVLTDKDYNQVEKYYSALLDLYSKQGVDMKEVIGELLEILTAADKGDRATVLNVTQYPEDVAQRFN